MAKSKGVSANTVQRNDLFAGNGKRIPQDTSHP